MQSSSCVKISRRCYSSFIDTHCHLDAIFPRWVKEQRETKGSNQSQSSDRRVVFGDLKSAFSSSFEGCVTIGCNAKTLDTVCSYLEHDDVYGSFGIHPLYAKDWLRADVQEKIKQLITHKKCVAWGECGLDYFDKIEGGILKDGSEKAVQQLVFIQQILLAVENNKPLVVHERSAAEVLLFRKEKKSGKTA